MTRRMGEITLAEIKRKWPHPVALASEKGRALKNSEVVRGFADTLSVAPRSCSLRRNYAEFVVFCFATQEDADVFCQRFGGDRLPETQR
jgi:hypothetical protein